MKVFLKIMLLVVMTGFLSVNAQVINLAQGWNNVGIANETSLNEFADSNISLIWEYDAQNSEWSVWSPNHDLMSSMQLDVENGYANYNFITHSIERNSALWIFTSQAESLRIGETGTVSSVFGVLKSTLDNSLINNFNISINGQVYDFADANGTFNVTNIPLGMQLMTIHADGYNDINYSVDLESETSDNLGQIYMLPINNTDANATVDITGIVRNSTTGSGVDSARVRFYQGYSNTNGTPVADTITDPSGTYSVNLPAGVYTVLITDDGYYRYEVNYTFSDNVSQDFSLTPELSNDVNGSIPLRVVLSWGESPRDLDSHLMAYEDNATLAENNVSLSSYFSNPDSSHWYVYYSNKNAPENIAKLDVDDTSSFGPETVTMNDVNNSLIYKYYVYNWSGSPALKDSHAHVVVFYNGREYDMNVPNEDGRVWKVFEIKNGIILPCVENCMSDMSGAGGVPSYSSIYSLRPVSDSTNDTSFLDLISNSYKDGK